jgi:hypothetical protein
MLGGNQFPFQMRALNLGIKMAEAEVQVVDAGQIQ